MSRLPILCPQEYEGTSMQVTPCTRCTHWSAADKQCTVPTGAEHLTPSANVPDCPIADQCQHQIQSSGPCAVRRAGLVCESALRLAAKPDWDPFMDPLSFNADLFE